MNAMTDLLVDASLRGLILALLASGVYQALRTRLAAAVRHGILLWALIALGLMPLLMSVCTGWKVLPETLCLNSAPAVSSSSVAMPAATEKPPLQPMAKASPPPLPERLETSPSPVTVQARVIHTPPPFQWPSWKSIALWLWLFGVVIGLLILAREWWQLCRLWAHVNAWHGKANLNRECCDRLALQRLPLIKIGTSNAGPLVLGFVKPGVLLPIDFDAWPEERQRAVLMHEFAHARRRDGLSHLLAALACVIHWFNPMVWWLFKQLRHEAECACDDVVLRADMQPAQYADHLLSVASGGRGASMLAPSMAQPSGLRRRVQAVLDARVRRGTAGWLALLVIAVAALTIGLPVMLAQTAEPKPAPPAAAKTETPHVAVTLKCRDAEGKALAGAQIRMFRVNKPQPVTPFAPEFSGTSDAAGEWHQDVPPGEYIALATKDDLVADGEHNETYWNLPKKDPKRQFELKFATGGTLHVSALDAVTGQPLVEAQVVVNSGHCGVTDEKGELVLKAVPMGEGELIVRSPPLGDTRLSFNTSGQPDAKVSIKLGPGFEVRGRVTNSEGKPIKGAAVRDHYSGPYLIVWLHKDVTDENGNYHLGWYPRSRPLWSMEVTHKDYAEQNRSEIAPPVEGQIATLDITMDEGLQITGEVRDEAGKPIKDATVRYGGPWSLVGLRWAKSGADGHFTIKKIGRTEQRPIVAEADGFSPMWQNAKPLKDPATKPLTFVMKRGLVVKGQIVDRAGKPVPNASVSPRMMIYGRSEYVGNNVWSDKDGRFELRNLAASDMSYDAWGKTVSPVRRVPLDPTKPLIVTVDRPGVLMGRVIDARTRKPITSYNVRLSFPKGKKDPNEPSPSYSAHLGGRGQECSAEDGRFVINDLITRARHDLWVTAPGYAMKHVERIAAAPADDPSWPLEIELEHGSAIRGTLTDAVTGATIGGARVFAVGKPAWYASTIRAEMLTDLRDYGSFDDVEILKSDERGAVDLHIPSASPSYTVVIQADGYEPVLLANQTSSNPQLPITALKPEAKVRGTLAGLPGFDPANGEVSVACKGYDSPQTKVQSDGSFAIGGLPAGLTCVSARTQSGEIIASRLVTLIPGNILTLDFLNEPSATLNVEVMVDGEPVSGARIGVIEPTEQLWVGQKTTDDDGKVTLSQLPMIQATVRCLTENGKHFEDRKVDLTQPGVQPTLKFEFKTPK